ncbi:MAG: hypothetical protein AVDCRST_MAG39-1321, partial [uncultured Sphingomonadaceae bacterium]
DQVEQARHEGWESRDGAGLGGRHDPPRGTPPGRQPLRAAAGGRGERRAAPLPRRGPLGRCGEPELARRDDRDRAPAADRRTGADPVPRMQPDGRLCAVGARRPGWGELRLRDDLGRL